MFSPFDRIGMDATREGGAAEAWRGYPVVGFIVATSFRETAARLAPERLFTGLVTRPEYAQTYRGPQWPEKPKAPDRGLKGELPLPDPFSRFFKVAASRSAQITTKNNICPEAGRCKPELKS
jgi:hypothetical protein